MNALVALWNRLWGQNTNKTVEVMPEETMSFGRSLWQAVQHLLTASGANILGPILMHLDPSMALFTSGVGTIFYSLATGIPAYMGTSFSYIAPIALVMTSSWGNQAMVGGGIIAAGITTFLVGLLVRKIGWRWINILMPPIILAMVVISIGLILIPIAWGEVITNPVLAAVTLVLGIVFATMFPKGHFISALPILLSIVVAYIGAAIFGLVDFKPVAEAPWFTAPRLFWPVFDMRVVTPMVMVTITAVLMEHLGHLKGTSSIVGVDYIPRTSQSLMADGVSNMLSWAGTPSVTYGENMGVFAVTRVFSIKVMLLAGGLAFLAGFMGKLSPLILSIPAGILGGATFLLFGLIAWAGLNLFQTEHVDIVHDRKNQIIAAVMFGIMVVAIFVEYLKPRIGSIDLTTIPLASRDAIATLQSIANSLTVGSVVIPGLVFVAVIGIALNLLLNWKEIWSELRVQTVPQVVEPSAAD